MKLRKFENKIDKYSEYLNISNKNIQLLKKSIKIMKKIGYEFVLKNHDTNGLRLFIYSKAFIYKSFICGVMQLGQASSLTGEVKSSFVIPFSPDDKPAIMIDINVFQSFVYHSLNVGRIDYIHALLFCYNFLKKDLPNEPELPVITLTKENKLVISS